MSALIPALPILLIETEPFRQRLKLSPRLSWSSANEYPHRLIPKVLASKLNLAPPPMRSRKICTKPTFRLAKVLPPPAPSVPLLVRASSTRPLSTHHLFLLGRFCSLLTCRLAVPKIADSSLLAHVLFYLRLEEPRRSAITSLQLVPPQSCFPRVLSAPRFPCTKRTQKISPVSVIRRSHD